SPPSPAATAPNQLPRLPKFPWVFDLGNSFTQLIRSGNLAPLADRSLFARFLFVRFLWLLVGSSQSPPRPDSQGWPCRHVRQYLPSGILLRGLLLLPPPASSIVRGAFLPPHTDSHRQGLAVPRPRRFHQPIRGLPK